MTTKTVELPLTKSEQRHLDNIHRRDAKRARSNARLLSISERDAKLKAINDDLGPKIEKLIGERNRKLEVVWDEWRERPQATRPSTAHSSAEDRIANCNICGKRLILKPGDDSAAGWAHQGCIDDGDAI
jgi:hypothetical protein